MINFDLYDGDIGAYRGTYETIEGARDGVKLHRLVSYCIFVEGELIEERGSDLTDLRV
jgi:hypothetical protein